jgi:hypothetical protein
MSFRRLLGWDGMTSKMLYKWLQLIDLVLIIS